MRMTLLAHIVAGGLGLVSGFVALYAAKGATLHRKSGMVFVYTMLAMCTTGLVIAVVQSAAPAVNVPAALLTAYLVTTALIAVRPPSPGGRWLDLGAMLVALALGLTCFMFGLEALASGGSGKGALVFPFFMFGGVGVLAGLSDLRMIRAGGLRRESRLARHLWRMCFALFIAAMSFFVGQADVIPKPVRIYSLLALPGLAVLLTMFYWLRRVRVRRTGHKLHEPAAYPSPT